MVLIKTSVELVLGEVGDFGSIFIGGILLKLEPQLFTWEFFIKVKESFIA